MSSNIDLDACYALVMQLVDTAGDVSLALRASKLDFLIVCGF